MPIKEFWEDYANEVIPKDAGQNQITECRRAFYAGAHAMDLIYLSTLRQDVNPGDAVKIIQDAKDELVDFRNKVGDGIEDY